MARQGLLPTPVGSSAMALTPARQGRSPENTHGESLVEAVARRFPTPTASDADRSLQDGTENREGGPTLAQAVGGLFPTPVASVNQRGAARSSGKSGRTLKEAVGLIPTPTSSEHKRANDGEWADRKSSRQGRRLVREARKLVLVPTPTARDYKGSDLPNRDGGPSLGQWVAGSSEPTPIQRSFWPTPTASDGSKARLTPSNNREGGPTLGAAVIADARRLPTPTTNPQAPNRNSNQKNGSPCLEEAALELAAGLIPTPSATDAKGSRRHGYMIEGNAGTTLTDFALGTTDSPESRGEASLCLNPRFVEWLMGWPLGWTEC